MTNIVAIPMLPVTSQTPLSSFVDSNRAVAWNRNSSGESPFAEAGISSWIEWTSKNETLLEVVREMPSPEECGCSKSQIETLRQFPPTIQRWLFPMAAFRKYGQDCCVALVDADTIISPTTPSIFQAQHGTDIGLTKDSEDEWTIKWRDISCRAFAPLFPDVDLEQSLYFNAGVILLNNPGLAIEFIKFALTRSSEFLAAMNSKVGTDQTPLNFLVQRLKKSGALSTSFLDPKWNARVDLALAAREPDQGRWGSLARSVVAENFISHFIMTKELMPAVWETMQKELHPRDQITEIL